MRFSVFSAALAGLSWWVTCWHSHALKQRYPATACVWGG